MYRIDHMMRNIIKYKYIRLITFYPLNFLWVLYFVTSHSKLNTLLSQFIKIQLPPKIIKKSINSLLSKENMLKCKEKWLKCKKKKKTFIT